MSEHFDCIVAGAGIVGITTALALAQRSWKVACIHPYSTPANPAHRALGLSLFSFNFLKQLIDKKHDSSQENPLNTASNPIAKLHLSSQGHFGRLLIDAQEHHLPALGFNTYVQPIYQALYQQLQQHSHVTLFSNTHVNDFSFQHPQSLVNLQTKNTQHALRATWVIAADGTSSTLRQQAGIASDTHNYQQTAWVSEINLHQSHQDTAYERLTPLGPLALLPIAPQRYTLIWSLSTDLAHTFQKAPERLLQALQQAIGSRLGPFTLNPGTCTTYPLQHVRAHTLTAPGLLLIGNAAHTLHPVAAQGFNLSLRDLFAWLNLLEEIREQSLDPHDNNLWQRYTTKRDKDHTTTQTITHQLATAHQNPPWTMLGIIGILTAIDLLPGLQERLLCPLIEMK